MFYSYLLVCLFCISLIPLYRIRGGGYGFESANRVISIIITGIISFLIFSWPIALSFSLSYGIYTFIPHGRWISMNNNARVREPNKFEKFIEKISDRNGRDDEIAMLLKSSIFPILFIIFISICSIFIKIHIHTCVLTILILFPFISMFGYLIGWDLKHCQKVNDPIIPAELISGSGFALLAIPLFFL